MEVCVHLYIAISTKTREPSLFMANSRLVKLRVETRATFATIFVATQVARPHMRLYHKIIDSDVECT